MADLSGLPPLLIQSGSAEALRDEHILLANRARRAGVKVRHGALASAVHIVPLMSPDALPARAAFVACGQWAGGLDELGAAIPDAVFDQVGALIEAEWAARQERLAAGAEKAEPAKRQPAGSPRRARGRSSPVGSRH